MTEAPTAPSHSGPPAGVAAGGPPPGFDPRTLAATYLEGHKSGLEGREDELARAIQQVIYTLKDRNPYPHEMNDALVKQILLSIQFAKDQNLLDEYIAKDIEVMSPVNRRMGALIEKTGEKEIALEGLAGYSPCHHHLVLQTWKEPGKRTWKSPFKTVLDAGVRIKQFDLTEEEIHNVWLKPRMYGFAKDLGVEVNVSDWNDDGIVVLSLA